MEDPVIKISHSTPWICHLYKCFFLHSTLQACSDMSQVSYIWSRDFHWFLNFKKLDRTSFFLVIVSNFNCSLFIKFPKYPGKSYGSLLFGLPTIISMFFIYQIVAFLAKHWHLNSMFYPVPLIWIFALPLYSKNFQNKSEFSQHTRKETCRTSEILRNNSNQWRYYWSPAGCSYSAISWDWSSRRVTSKLWKIKSQKLPRS